MSDRTEEIRRQMIASRAPEMGLLANDGPTWNTAELTRDFDVLGFQAPFVVVRRRVDGVLGSLVFTHSPRVYFGWEAD